MSAYAESLVKLRDAFEEAEGPDSDPALSGPIRVIRPDGSEELIEAEPLPPVVYTWAYQEIPHGAILMDAEKRRFIHGEVDPDGSMRVWLQRDGVRSPLVKFWDVELNAPLSRGGTLAILPRALFDLIEWFSMEPKREAGEEIADPFLARQLTEEFTVNLEISSEVREALG